MLWGWVVGAGNATHCPPKGIMSGFHVSGLVAKLQTDHTLSLRYEHGEVCMGIGGRTSHPILTYGWGWFWGAESEVELTGFLDNMSLSHHLPGWTTHDFRMQEKRFLLVCSTTTSDLRFLPFPLRNTCRQQHGEGVCLDRGTPQLNLGCAT